METGELIFIGFCSLAAINALFFTVYIWFRREKNIYPNILLSLFMLITAFRIIQMLLHDLQDDFNIGIDLRLIFFFFPTFPLVGPLLWFYIRSFSSNDFKFRPAHLLHLLPFIAVFISDLLNRNKFPLDPYSGQYFIYAVQVTFVLVQFLIYIVISYRYAHRISKTNENRQREGVDPRWIRNIVLIISVLWMIYALYCVQTYTRYYLPTRVFEALYYSFFSYWILIYELHGQKITTATNFTKRYKYSALSPADSIRLKDLILDHVKTTECYKDHNITLGKLSKNISLTPHVVSQVVNEQLYCNFNDLINSYRVEEAKVMLKDPSMKHLTIASIAYDCGFNTLSAFNTAFRKFTGITPSQFRSLNKVIS